MTLGLPEMFTSVSFPLFKTRLQCTHVLMDTVLEADLAICHGQALDENATFPRKITLPPSFPRLKCQVLPLCYYFSTGVEK